MSSIEPVPTYLDGTPRVRPVGGISPDGRCCAQSKSRGGRCAKPAIQGGSVCRYHGGAAPQTVQAANARLMRDILPAAVERHLELITQGRNEAAVGAMIRDTYDRTGVGIQRESEDTEIRELLIRVREYRHA